MFPLDDVDVDDVLHGLAVVEQLTEGHEDAAVWLAEGDVERLLHALMTASMLLGDVARDVSGMSSPEFFNRVRRRLLEEHITYRASRTHGPAGGRS